MTSLERARQQELEAQKLRWVYLVAYRSGHSDLVWAGPYYLNDYDTHQLVFTTRLRYPDAQMYRLVYSPVQHVWIWDPRTEGELLVSQRPIPGYDRVA